MTDIKISKKVQQENDIFNNAIDYLTEIYGDFERVVEQQDRPDAAIKLKSSDYTIGIEITTVDSERELEYFNDRKHSINDLAEDIERCLRGEIPETPFKKLATDRPKHSLFEAINKKTSKFKEYKKNGNFNELIILTFSDYIGVDESYFKPFLVPWTYYLLSRSDFPYTKVIFVDRETKECVLLYDKKRKMNMPPRLNQDITSTRIETKILPVNKTINLNDMFKGEPEVKPKPKCKRRKRK
ncbi:hypothetical protein [Pantoea agglomerans]|uniref:hypothetical protein n=1 Tax=Enterobacter agglomerans TaxID=549 RepID=UPI003FD61ED8